MAITPFQKRKILAKFYLSDHLFDLYIRSNKLDDYQRLLQYFPDGGFFMLKEMVDYLSDLTPKVKDNAQFDENAYLESNKTLYFNKGRLTTLKSMGQTKKEVTSLNDVADHLSTEKQNLRSIIADQILKSLCYQESAPDVYTEIDADPAEPKDDFMSLVEFFIIDTTVLETVYDILNTKNNTDYKTVITNLKAKYPVFKKTLTLLQ